MLFESNSFEKNGTICSIETKDYSIKRKPVQKLGQFEVMSEVLQEKLSLVAF